MLPVIYGTHSHSHNHQNSNEFDYGIVIMFGFLLCFFLEMIIRLRQQQSHNSSHSSSHSHIKAFGWLNLFGDGIHNFMDGMGLAGAFHVSNSLGLATTLCICFHELPQELSDFGVLLSAGFSVQKALLFNFLSGVIAVVGCLTGLIINQHSLTTNSWLLKLLNEKALVSITAGSFLYIIASMTNELWSQIFSPENTAAVVTATTTTTTTATATTTTTDKQKKKQQQHTPVNKSATASLVTSVIGIATGIGIMYMISKFEHDILHWF
jgi:zinc transporter ZupT